jgi:TctA family transporter
MGVGLASWFGQVPSLSNNVLIPVIVAVSLVGAYTVEFNFFYVWQVLFFGFVGYVLIRFGFSIIAFILGIILVPLAEDNLYRSFQISGGDIFSLPDPPTLHGDGSANDLIAGLSRPRPTGKTPTPHPDRPLHGPQIICRKHS